MPATRLADIDIDSLTREQLRHLLERWAHTITGEGKRRVHGKRVPPGAQLLVNWLDCVNTALEQESEPLGDTKMRVREFLGRLSTLEGIPLEVDLPATFLDS